MTACDSVVNDHSSDDVSDEVLGSVPVPAGMTPDDWGWDWDRDQGWTRGIVARRWTVATTDNAGCYARDNALAVCADQNTRGQVAGWHIWNGFTADAITADAARKFAAALLEAADTLDALTRELAK